MENFLSHGSFLSLPLTIKKTIIACYRSEFISFQDFPVAPEEKPFEYWSVHFHQHSLKLRSETASKGARMILQCQSVFQTTTL